MSVAAAAALLAPLPVHAADVVVGSNTTLTTKQLLSAAGDTLTVEVGGTIDVAGDNAVEVTASGVSIVNAGDVIGDLIAIDMSGDGNSIQNIGKVMSAGIGIQVEGASNTIFNADWISGETMGIDAAGGNAIVNGGTISANSGAGVSMGSDSTLDNSGTITAATQGVSLGGTGSSVTNSGTIASDYTGIFAQGQGNMVTNAGRIEAVTEAVYILGSGNSIENAGSIFASEVGLSVHGGSNSIANEGRIVAGVVGIDAYDGNSIVNAGTVSAAETAISLSHDSVLANSGTVTGGIRGLLLYTEGNSVTNSGLISGSVLGMDASDKNSIINSGTVEGGLDGIVIGASNNVVNAGLIRGERHGINTYGRNTIVNSGTIIAGTGVGIFASFSSVIDNAGVITAGLPGIGIDGDGNLVTNSGSVHAGESGVGIEGSRNAIANSGLLHGDLYGVVGWTNATQNAVVNSGTISGDSIGIAFVSNNTITNSGTITGGIAAVEFAGTGNTLVLLKGSIIEGLLSMGSGNSLSVVRGVNAAYSYSGDPVVSSSGRGPLADTGSVIVTLDDSGFSAPEDMTDDLARIIADRTDARLLSLWAEDAGPGTGMWLEVLGGSRAANGHDLMSGGVIAGADHSIGAGHAGGLAGLARGSSRFDGSSEYLTSTSYFGGLYGTYAFESIVLNAALTGGVSSFDGKRDVFDNMASGGTDQASWQSTGLFASPSITVSLPLDMEAGTLVPSLRGRYGAMRMGSYTEDWASIDLDVDSRMVHLLDVRGQIAWLGSLAAGELGHLDVKLRAGGDLAVSRGGEIQIDLAGTVMDFAAGDDGLETRGFVGFDIGFKPGINTTVSLSGTLGLDQSGALSMDAGLRVARPL